MTKTPEEILAEVAGMFTTPQKKRHTSPPCLVCGRPCRAAMRVHPRCRTAVGTDRARQLWGEWAQREKRRKQA